MAGIGGNAQDRRRTRRAAGRRAEGDQTTFTLSPADVDDIRAIVAAATDDFGGKPNSGTKPDKRLKENKDASAVQPEDAALDALDALVPDPGAAALAALDVLQAAEEELSPVEIATAFVKIRPDLSGFEEEIERVVRDAIRKGLTAAAAAVAWGAEEGFMDLLCDVNEQIRTSDDSFYPWATDVSVKLDKALICDEDGYYVAEITIGNDSEPTVANRGEWTKVEEQWVESNDEMTGRYRDALRTALTADGALAPPIPAQHQPAETLPDASTEISPPEQAPAAASGVTKWRAVFVPEATLTEDGRAFAPEALTWRELPLTLMAMTKTSAEGGHDGAEIAGKIENIWRSTDEDGKPIIEASGFFDSGEYGSEIARMVGDGVLRGLSIDIAPLEWERSPKSDWFSDDGKWIAEKNDDGDWLPAVQERSMEDAIEALFSGDAITVITKGVIGMATVCPFPAFEAANIALTASGVTYKWEGQAGFLVFGDAPALVASAAPAAVEEEAPAAEPVVTASAAGDAPAVPPSEWFSDPELTEVTPLTITPEGHIFGHAWDWSTCHIAFPDECVLAPHSATDYAYFHLGEVELDNGTREPVGRVTIDTGHAGQRLSRAEAVRHYDDTGTVAAYVVMGEDEFGGWFSGSIRPDLPEETLRLLRGSSLSGDWRGVNGNLELIALLAVNVPGFPIPRQRALVAAGEDGPEVLSLTAAGIVCGPFKEEQAAVDEIRALAEAAAA